MHQHKVERVPVVKDAFVLVGLLTVKDITKHPNFPKRRTRRFREVRLRAAVGGGRAPSSASKRWWAPGSTRWWSIRHMATAMA